MLFKNIQIFHWPADARQWPEDAHASFQENAFQPPAKTQPASSGWVNPVDSDSDELLREVMGVSAACLLQQERILPSSVIREHLEDKIAEIEAKEGRKPGKKEKEQLKEELIFTLLPQAFTRSRRMYGMVEDSGDWLMVDQSSANRAEEWVASFNDTLGTSGIVRPKLNASPSGKMTDWLTQGSLPEGFAFGDKVVLQDPKDSGIGISIKGHELLSEEVQAHVEAGLKVSSMQLEWQERIRFVLTDDFNVKQIKWLENDDNEIDAGDDTDQSARFDAEILLAAKGLNQLVEQLYQALNVS